jgi:hypothetical protein
MIVMNRLALRKIVSLAAVLALSACGGGGGGTSGAPQPPAPTAAPTTVPAGFVTPQFVLVIPGRKGSTKNRTPQYISSATASVKITLTSDSIGVDPTTIGGNPVITNITAGSCNSGCAVNGPPTPPGTDSFTIVTYDANGATGHAINAGQANNISVTAGQSNPIPVTLGAIPATLSISNVPSGAGSLSAGTTGQTTAISIIAVDGHGDTIPTAQSPAVFFAAVSGAALNVTVTDPDTQLHGSCVINTGTSSCTSGSPTSVTFSGPDITRLLAYDGLAENPVTLTASASGATNGTASFAPALHAPVFNSSQATPSGIALTGSAEIDLFTPSGTGSTGSESFTENGWTNTPYNQALLVTGTPSCTNAGPLSTFATVSAGSNSTTNGTPFTATAVASPVAGNCPVTVGDGLSLNSTDGSATLTVTYTTGTVNANSKKRHQ